MIPNQILYTASIPDAPTAGLVFTVKSSQFDYFLTDSCKNYVAENGAKRIIRRYHTLGKMLFMSEKRRKEENKRDRDREKG